VTLGQDSLLFLAVFLTLSSGFHLSSFKISSVHLPFRVDIHVKFFMILLLLLFNLSHYFLVFVSDHSLGMLDSPVNSGDPELFEGAATKPSRETKLHLNLHEFIGA